MYGIFGSKITKYTVIYGVYIRFWPTLNMHFLLSIKLNVYAHQSLGATLGFNPTLDPTN